MERITIQVGSYEVNCSALIDGGRAWIVDPGSDPDAIEATLAKAKAEPELILLTHAHFDHIGAVSGLQTRHPGLPVYLHPADFPALGHPMNQFPPEYPLAPVPANLRDCRDLEGVTVIETPGHTPGGCCYYFPSNSLLLSGDTLFAGSVGRTDFPGGDMKTLMESLAKLLALPDSTTVVPGHGPLTTIGAERRGNPFLC